MPVYWVLDLVAQRLLEHRDPTPDGYRTISEHHRGDVLPVLGIDIHLDELLLP